MMRNLYYRRDGTLYLGENNFREWGRDFENIKKRLVARTELNGGIYVSTIWLGLDHGFGVGAPLIFETLVFTPGGGFNSLDMVRYSTEAEAKRGHRKLVTKWSNQRRVRLFLRLRERFKGMALSREKVLEVIEECVKSSRRGMVEKIIERVQREGPRCD